jgi:hypothetical protein
MGAELISTLESKFVRPAHTSGFMNLRDHSPLMLIAWPREAPSSGLDLGIPALQANLSFGTRKFRTTSNICQ